MSLKHRFVYFTTYATSHTDKLLKIIDIMKGPTNLHNEHRPRSTSNASLDDSTSTSSLTVSLTDEGYTHQSSKSHVSQGTSGRSYLVRIPPHFILLTLVIVCGVAFSVGTISRVVLLSSMGIHPSAYPPNTPASIQSDVKYLKHYLPVPVRINDKELPPTTYSSTQVLPQVGATTSHSVHMDRKVNLYDENNITNDVDTNQEQHLPSGQHLLVDLKNVDPTFLNSEQQLAEAMVELAIISKVNLLSYHCHSIVPMGVSCVGILLESHVS